MALAKILWVDDEIENLQSQIDGLKTSVAQASSDAQSAQSAAADASAKASAAESAANRAALRHALYP